MKKRAYKELITEFLLLTAAILDISLLWHSQMLSFIITLAITATAFKWFHDKEDIVFFLVGAVLGTVIEVICSGAGAWHYSRTLFLGVPGWLPVMWGFLVLFARRMRDTIFRLSYEKKHYRTHHTLKTNWILIYDTTLYILLIGLIVFFWKQNILLLIIFAALLVVTLEQYHYQEDVFFALFAGIMGVLAEWICLTVGAWTYSNPTFGGVPVWLPVSYAIFGIVVRRFAVAINNKLRNLRENKI